MVNQRRMEDSGLGNGWKESNDVHECWTHLPVWCRWSHCPCLLSEHPRQHRSDSLPELLLPLREREREINSIFCLAIYWSIKTTLIFILLYRCTFVAANLRPLVVILCYCNLWPCLVIVELVCNSGSQLFTHLSVCHKTSVTTIQKK